MTCCRHCEEHVPGGATILARATYECCVVFVVDGVVTKMLRDSVRPQSIINRAKVAAEHPDLFAPIKYDAEIHAIHQPFVAGSMATNAELRTVLDELSRRELWHLTDIGASNVIGGKVVDFMVGTSHRATRRAMRRRGSLP